MSEMTKKVGENDRGLWIGLPTIEVLVEIKTFFKTC